MNGAARLVQQQLHCRQVVRPPVTNLAAGGKARRDERRQVAREPAKVIAEYQFGPDQIVNLAFARAMVPRDNVQVGHESLTP